MATFDVVLIVVLTAIIVGAITTIIYNQEVWHLNQENRMLRHLLSEQAKLHQMSLNAYISMLQESQRHKKDWRA